MKKLFFTLMLIFVSAITLNAQSLTGKQWATKLLDEEGTEIVVSLYFDENGACEMLVGTDYEIKEDGVPITLEGSVTKQIRDEINGLKKDFQKEMLDGMPKMHNMKIVKLEKKNLVIKDDNGDEIPFVLVE